MKIWEMNELGLRCCKRCCKRCERCCKPCIVVRDSICLPSWDITSGCHDLDLALKLPSIIVKEGLNCQNLTKLDKN